MSRPKPPPAKRRAAFEKVCCVADGCFEVIDRPAAGMGPEAGAARYCAKHRKERKRNDPLKKVAAAANAVLRAEREPLPEFRMAQLIALTEAKLPPIHRVEGKEVRYAFVEVDSEVWDRLVELAREVLG